MPLWCELEHFEVVTLPKGGRHVFPRRSRKEKLIVARGRCTVACADRAGEAAAGANLDLLAPEGQLEVLDVAEPAKLVRLAGRWGEEIGGSGLFSVVAADKREDPGLALGFVKNTSFDNHYHDCDEYWVIVEGSGAVVTEGRRYAVSPGDCVATGMGHHHDFTEVEQPVLAARIETTLGGRKRRGHLWTHRDGKAEARVERPLLSKIIAA